MSKTKGRLTADEATEYSSSLGKAATGNYELMDFAINTLRVPESLGMEAGEWVESIGGYVRRGIEDRRSAVKELTGEGKTNSQIAKILGVSLGTIDRDRSVLKALANDSPQAQIEAKTQAIDGPGERKKAIRRLIDEGKSNAQIAAALGGMDPSGIQRHRKEYAKELEAIAKTAKRPRSNTKRKLTEAEAKAMLDGRLARVELAALHLLAWWEQEGQAALTTDLGWIDENIAHTEEKVTMIFQSVRGLKTDADAALAQWTAEAEGRSEA